MYAIDRPVSEPRRPAMHPQKKQNGEQMTYPNSEAKKASATNPIGRMLAGGAAMFAISTT
jgi:hypothetical protein